MTSSVSNPPCRVCEAAVSVLGHTTVRHKYPATFLVCDGCGFVFVEKADWLAEAYAEPINISDTGYVARNLYCQNRVRMFIELFLNSSGRFLDYGAGFGLFVRLMRDLGYDFRWSDRYCKNLFARGFEETLPLRDRYEAITAFEVFEHLTDPIEETEKLARATDCLIFTTEILPQSPPKLGDWWYYGLEHGQHISFYTRKTLEIIARRFGFNLLSDGSGFHAMTRGVISPKRFGRLDNRWWNAWVRRTRRREPLVASDRDQLVRPLPQTRNVPS